MATIARRTPTAIPSAAESPLGAPGGWEPAPPSPWQAGTRGASLSGTAAPPFPRKDEGHPADRVAFMEKIRQRPTLPHGYPSSTIGAGGLNDSVRNGKRCGPSAIATGISRRERQRIGKSGHLASADNSNTKIRPSLSAN